MRTPFSWDSVSIRLTFSFSLVSFCKLFCFCVCPCLDHKSVWKGLKGMKTDQKHTLIITLGDPQRALHLLKPSLSPVFAKQFSLFVLARGRPQCLRLPSSSAVPGAGESTLPGQKHLFFFYWCFVPYCGRALRNYRSNRRWATTGSEEYRQVVLWVGTGPPMLGVASRWVGSGPPIAAPQGSAQHLVEAGWAFSLQALPLRKVSLGKRDQAQRAEDQCWELSPPLTEPHWHPDTNSTQWTRLLHVVMLPYAAAASLQDWNSRKQEEQK